MLVFPSWLPPGAHHAGIWIKGIVDARQENPQWTVAFMNKLYLPKLVGCLWTLIYFLWFLWLLYFGWCLLMWKSHLVLLINLEITAEVRKVERKEKKGCLLYNGKTFCVKNNSLYPFKCHFTLFCNCTISRVIWLFIFFFFPSGVKNRIECIVKEHVLSEGSDTSAGFLCYFFAFYSLDSAHMLDGGWEREREVVKDRGRRREGAFGEVVISSLEKGRVL